MSASALVRTDEARWSLIRANLKEDLARDDKAHPTSPTVWEAVRVKRLLGTLPLPLELVESIMDFAEYWPCTYSTMKDSIAVLNTDDTAMMDFSSVMFTYHHWVPEAVGEHILLKTDPLGFRSSKLTKGSKASWTNRGLRKLALKPFATQHDRHLPLPTRGSRPFRKIVFSIVGREDCKQATEAATWYEVTLQKVMSHNAESCETGNNSAAMAAGCSIRSEHNMKLASSQRGILKSVQSFWQRPISDTSEVANPQNPKETENPDSPSWRIVCYNEPITKLNKRHIIEWRHDDEVDSSDTGPKGVYSHVADFVRSMELGDSLMLRARTSSRPGWSMNYVASARVAIYWAV